MLRLFLLGLVLLGTTRAEFELQLKEHSETPGVSRQRYELVSRDEAGNDQVVGQMVRIQSTDQGSGGPEGALQQLGGRRMGAGLRLDLHTVPHPFMVGMVPSLLDHLTAVSMLRGQLYMQMHQARCAMMRQFSPDFHVLNQRLGSRLAPMLVEGAQAGKDFPVEASVEGTSPDESKEEELISTLFGSDVLPAADTNAAQLPPFRLQPIFWHKQAGEGRDWHHHHPMMGMGDMVGPGEPKRGPFHHHNHMVMMGRGEGEEHHNRWGLWGRRKEQEEMQGQEPAIADWVSLKNGPLPMPAYDEEEPGSINWSFRNEDGSINLGLLLFVALSGACAGVWAAGIVSWVAYTRQLRQAHSRAQFLMAKPSGDLLSPLLPEGPCGSPKLYTGVEVAADHVDKAAKATGLL